MPAIAAALLIGLGWLVSLSRAGHLARPRAIAAARHHVPVAPPAPPRPAGPPLSSLHGAPVSVAVRAGSPGRAVPADFLGMSFEMSDLPHVARYAGSGDLVTLMRALGPGVARFGGVSADDRAAWSPNGGTLPRWARTAISPSALAGIGRLARETGWRVLVTLGLAHRDARAGASEAAAARHLIGAGLAGIEIGNEPDAYVAGGLRSPPWRFRQYQRQVASYLRAIDRVAPGVRLAAPDVSSGEAPLGWVSAAAHRLRPALLTDHYYPLTHCGAVPRLGALGAEVVRDAQSTMISRLATISRRAGIPLRLDETNNVSCAGQPGVSNAFASALWAVDYGARVMTTRLAGLNFHDLIGSPHSYAPLATDSRRDLSLGRLHAKPEWYALLLLHELLGDRPVHARVGAGHPELTATAFLGPGHPGPRLDVVLDDFAPPRARPLLVRLRVPRGYASGTVLRLTAPSRASVRGVTLGGGAVAADGSWSPHLPLPAVSGGPGTLALRMAAGTAALVTLDAPS
jgi:hypothetical protein